MPLRKFYQSKLWCQCHYLFNKLPLYQKKLAYFEIIAWAGLSIMTSESGIYKDTMKNCYFLCYVSQKALYWMWFMHSVSNKSFMLSVIMLGVVMLRGVVPHEGDGTYFNQGASTFTVMTLIPTTLGITTVGIVSLIITKLCSMTLSVTTLSIMMSVVIMRCNYAVSLKYVIIMCHYSVSLCCVIMLCHYAESLCCIIKLCHYAVSLCCIIKLCHYAVSLCCVIMLCHYDV